MITARAKNWRSSYPCCLVTFVFFTAKLEIPGEHRRLHYLYVKIISFLLFCGLRHCSLVTNLEVFWMIMVFPASAANDLEGQFAGHVYEVESSSKSAQSNEHAALQLRSLMRFYP